MVTHEELANIGSTWPYVRQGMSESKMTQHSRVRGVPECL